MPDARVANAWTTATSKGARVCVRGAIWGASPTVGLAMLVSVSLLLQTALRLGVVEALEEEAAAVVASKACVPTNGIRGATSSTIGDRRSRVILERPP